jgi:hypothetical protein
MMKIQEDALSRKANTGMVNMDLWIKKYFGSQDNLDEFLKLSLKTTNRWMNHSPKKFMEHIPELQSQTGQSVEDIINMIMIRANDVTLSQEPSAENS